MFTRKLNLHIASALIAGSFAFMPSATMAMHHGMKDAAQAAGAADIVDTAVAAGQFATLAKALTAAGLIDTLKGPGPFTVFAPTDAAFAKLPADKLNALLADKVALTKVLTYHVVPGKVMAADVKSGKAKTVQGQDLNLKVSSKGVKVNDATVTKTDILATNGVIHVIDRVVMPK
jgi:uncharacterized surface protein with fasciclin (FAS1) repeats